MIFLCSSSQISCACHFKLELNRDDAMISELAFSGISMHVTDTIIHLIQRVCMP
ncbi:hypothetical protein GW17_00042413 [Ensete ventricosum]|nr:hypothetical protein GW17_00042413 [Ensete ventricosum]